ncbi:hypothetical protein [Flavivirga eckloniae]|uniref:Tetratricopeptide repeat protein n=1 Tax=Flavivirga eckloniae TaxID=1803846 RepID=A0A2K9PNX9_9FLAO|nr:hypothetical protein [Flavivirga eckloniae]AUP78745.1 hypothetical protein C1H87_08550 [Flavivirga eckloniae]
MNSKDFVNILQHPQTITRQQTEAVKSVIDEFPYFQSARAVYLKGLKNASSFKYNQELKTTAAYTTDRSILFDFITSEAFIQNEISQFIKQNTTHLKDVEVTVEDISVNKNVTIDHILKQQINDTQGVLDPALFQPKEERPQKTPSFVLDESEEIENVTEETKPVSEETQPTTEEPQLAAEETKTQETLVSDILNLGRPLEFNKKETHSFNEWLKLTCLKPIDRDQDSDTKAPPAPLSFEPVSSEQVASKTEPPKKEDKSSEELDKAKKFELIDQFITKNPKINPFKATITKGNLAKAQMIKPEALMTETLARIYVEQKNYKKAIQSYKILSLKYPEKSGFFADQIKAVEELQEQNKI